MKYIIMLFLAVYVQVKCENSWGQMPTCLQELNALSDCQQDKAKITALRFDAYLLYPENCSEKGLEA